MVLVNTEMKYPNDRPLVHLTVYVLAVEKPRAIPASACRSCSSQQLQKCPFRRASTCRETKSYSKKLEVNKQCMQFYTLRSLIFTVWDKIPRFHYHIRSKTHSSNYGGDLPKIHKVMLEHKTKIAFRMRIKKHSVSKQLKIQRNTVQL